MLKEQNSYSIVKKKRFKPPIEKLRFRKSTYIIDIGNYTYSDGLKRFYCIDVEQGQISFENHNNTGNNNPKIVDLVMSQKIISELSTNMSDKQIKFNILLSVVFCILGGLIGYIIAVSI